MEENRTIKSAWLALAWANLMVAAAAIYIAWQAPYRILNTVVILLMAVGVSVAFVKGVKKGMLSLYGSLAVTAVVAGLTGNFHVGLFVFWALWIPLAVYAAHQLDIALRALMQEKDYYKGRMEEINLVDDITQLKNVRAYQNDAPIYMKISNRYHMQLVLVVWQLHNHDELREKISQAAYREMMQSISKRMRKAIRLEDIAYSLHDGHNTWGLLMFTRAEAIQVVLDRLNAQWPQVRIDCPEEPGVRLDMRAGYAIYDGEKDQTPTALLKSALEDLQARAHS